MASGTGANRAGIADPPAALTAGSSSLHQDDRDWASLTSGPLGLIAERVLSDSGDIPDYFRFRAVCAGWRACCADPRAQGVADRRFHPRRWVMLPSAFSFRRRRCFLNVSTGERFHTRIIDLRRYQILGPTVEGLLLLRQHYTGLVKLLNPLTAQYTSLPAADTMYVADRPAAACRHGCCACTHGYLKLRSAGIADDSTVALHYTYHGSNAVAVAKPGDERWTVFTLDPAKYGNPMMTMVVPYAGRLYCVTYDRIMVVEAAGAEQQRPPRLEEVPLVRYELELEDGPSKSDDWMYPAYDGEGNLILVHRSRRGGGHTCEKYTTYQAKLDTGTVVRMRGLGGQEAMFLCRGRSQCVPVCSRASSTITADTVYVCAAAGAWQPEVVAFDVIAGRVSDTGSRRFDKKAIAGAVWRYMCSAPGRT